jgi:hypothetical protein
VAAQGEALVKNRIGLIGTCVIAGAILSGCVTSDATSDRTLASIRTASAPDTLQAGEPLTLSVTWTHNCCTKIESAEFQTVNESTVTFTLYVSGNNACLCPAVDETSKFVLAQPPQGTFVVRVRGANGTIELTVHHAG